MKIILSVIGTVLLIVIAGDIYLLYAQKHNALHVPATSLSTTSQPIVTAVATTTQPTANIPTVSSSGRVLATISVVKNYQGNPLSIAATCTIHTTAKVYALDFSYGNTKAEDMVNYPPVPVSHSKTFVQTYTSPGAYTLECLPVYDPSTDTSFDTPYVGKKTITLGGYIAPAQNNIIFSFSPTTGMLPLQVQTACSINTTGNVTSLAVGVDSPSQFDITGGETLADKFIIFDANSEGMNHSDTYSGTLPSNKYWKGIHNVYCSATINNQRPEIISKPIQVNFQ